MSMYSIVCPNCLNIKGGEVLWREGVIAAVLEGLRPGTFISRNHCV